MAPLPLRTEFLETGLHSVDFSCAICQRPYKTFDDSDPNDKPEYPIELTCGHHLGIDSDEESDTAQERHQTEEDFAPPDSFVGLKGIGDRLRHADTPPPSEDGSYTFAADDGHEGHLAANAEASGGRLLHVGYDTPQMVSDSDIWRQIITNEEPVDLGDYTPNKLFDWSWLTARDSWIKALHPLFEFEQREVSVQRNFLSTEFVMHSFDAVRSLFWEQWPSSAEDDSFALVGEQIGAWFTMSGLRCRLLAWNGRTTRVGVMHADLVKYMVSRFLRVLGRESVGRDRPSGLTARSAEKIKWKHYAMRVVDHVLVRYQERS
ncbi:hypothetical protein LTS18_006599 [Coniosporium uncinatum]|uniref:Uncharacterized protein n=1 Tax=Coniosporium uncinatum TaxID=93489 RepID=A0ACC3D3K6_9PEZI|nr:hypothetical protein LTS18_006599 [Coniosporium uncinatum]